MNQHRVLINSIDCSKNRRLHLRVLSDREKMQEE